MRGVSMRQQPRPTTGPRVSAALAALPLTALAATVAIGQLRNGFDVMGSLMLGGFGSLALLCIWFAIRGANAEAHARMRGALRTAFLLGPIGFIVGFVGPLLLAPDANQGPLLGFFVTGPAGFMVGLLAGWIAPGLVRRRSP